MTQATTTVRKAELALRLSWLRRLEQARHDPNAFIELAFRNDQDPAMPPFRQQPFHREWQRAWLEEQTTVLHGATGFGKSEQLLGHLVWRVGNSPAHRITLVGKQQANAIKHLQKIRRMIDENPVVKAVFPQLKRGDVWTDEKLRVADAPIDLTTNTIETYGLEGSPQGLRGDEIILDDVVDYENTRTEHQRRRNVEFVDTVVQSRLTTRGQLHVLANAWDPDDMPFTLARRPGVWHGVYPAEREDGTLLWPDFRTREWLDQKRRTMGDLRYAQMFLCKPADESTRLFRDEWFAKARALGAGTLPRESVGHHFDHEWRPLPNADITQLPFLARQELRVVVGCDLATGDTEKKRKNDFTCFVVVGVDADNRRHLLWIEKGRWEVGESVRRLAAIDRRYRPDKILVESNGAQRFFLSYAREFSDFRARIEPYVTGEEKWSPSVGIEAIGMELAAGRWTIPAPRADQALTDEQRQAQAYIDELCSHLLAFSRVGHTPDDVMALWFAQRGASGLASGVFQGDAPRDAGAAWNPLEGWDRTAAGPAGTAPAFDVEEALEKLPPIPDYLRGLL